MSVIKLSPLDKEGIRFDRPSSEVIWQKLTNCLFKDGSIVPRPGFKSVYGIGSDDFVSLELSPPIFIGQIRNPGSTSTGREGYTVKTETVRPNASSNIVAGWTGDHLDIDDNPPDGTTVIVTSTTLATKGVEFAAMSTTYDAIQGIILRGRAKVSAQNQAAELGFYFYTGATLYLIDTLIVTSPSGESDPWVEFAFPLAAYPDGHPLECRPFDDDTFDAAVFAVKLLSASVFTYEALAADANGTYTAWKDASDGGTAGFADVGPFHDVIRNAELNSTLHYMSPAASGSGAGKKQSFGFTAANTYTSVSGVTFYAWGTKSEPTAPKFELYWRSSGGTETLVNTFTGQVGRSGMTMISLMATNPGGGAWTGAAFNAGEFFINTVFGGSDFVLRHVGAAVEGVISGTAQVSVDYLAIDICGATTSAPGAGIIDYTRLWSNNRNHFRLGTDGGSISTITDITNSVAMSTSPPNIPVDYTTFYGQIYAVNGRDATRVYPTVANVFTSLTTNNSAASAKLTGRTVCAHGNRILYGWTTDDTTVTPERIAYSTFNVGSTHNTVSAGDLDLLDTPGGVIKLIELNDDIVAALKEEGVYNLIKTGQAAFPYRRDVIDFETGCIAKMTAKRITLASGDPAIIFLGENPSKGGINVFLFNGSQVTPVGNPIARKLQEESNMQSIPNAFAEVDPITGSYWLFVAETCSGLLPNSAWVMNINTFAWTRAEFPFNISCAGQWNLLPDLIAATAISDGSRFLRGERKMVLGTTEEVPFAANHTTAVDTFIAADNSSVPFGDGGKHSTSIVSVLETGDLVRPNDVQVASYRLHMAVKVRGYTVRVAVSSSVDGGLNFNTEQEFAIDLTANLDLNERKYIYLDLTPSHSSIVRYKVEIGPDTSTALLDQISPVDSPWQIDDIRIELISTGDGA